MNDQDMDRLLEQGLSGDRPGQVFRARVLRDSTTAFVRARRSHARWRPTALSAAAAFIATVSFLLGRGSAPQSPAGPTIAIAPDTVVVPSELVVWLDAARLFKQLGMEDRKNRAIDCASRLLPREVIAVDSAARFISGAEEVEGRAGPGGASLMPDSHQSMENVDRILAESLGGYYHASARD